MAVVLYKHNESCWELKNKTFKVEESICKIKSLVHEKNYEKKLQVKSSQIKKGYETSEWSFANFIINS